MAVSAQHLARMERLHSRAIRFAAVSFGCCLALWTLSLWIRAALPKDGGAPIPKAVALAGVGLALLMLAGGGTAITSLYCVTLSALGPGGRGLERKHIVVGVLLVPFGIVAAGAMARIFGR